MTKFNLTAGKLYGVVLEDCCVSGSFTARLIRLGPEDWPDKELVFENGVCLTKYYQCIFTEIKEPDAKP